MSKEISEVLISKEEIQIRKMAEFINTFDIDEKICKHNFIGIDCELEDNDCIKCIIDHFK